MNHPGDALVQRAARGDATARRGGADDGASATEDRDALALLWDELTPKLFGYLINTLGDRALAEDILQTTWLRAIEGLPRFRDRGKGLRPWLFAIARNECRQHWRKDPHEVPLDLATHDTGNSDAYELERKVLVEQALEQLPEDDRELIRLRYIADLPTAHIARILHINFVTVRVRIHRALARARIALQSQKS